MWQSHFEESAPLLGSLAEAYPAEEAIGTRASSVFRSLAYYDIAQTAHAVEIEKRLLTANPADLDRLARIGDIYADSGSASAPGHENIRAAKPYWRRIPSVHPGTTAGYLQAATIFWDYYQFDDALAEIQAARTRFDQPRLFGYEAGAIEEGKRDMAAAIQEYLSVATGAADGSDSEAAMRLLQLARRKATAKTVDQATAKALETQNTVAALELRERVLKVQRRNRAIADVCLEQSGDL
jgi:tetratricopeptide (TPR) repeat protein